MSGFSIGGVGQGILSLTIKDVANLHAAYMPFVENGGLFIPTKKKYSMGDEIFVLLTLIDEADKTTDMRNRDKLIFVCLR